MKIGISADSTCDLPKELIEKYDITIVPLYVNLGEDQYTEAEITYKEIYDFVDKTDVLPKTSARNVEEYKEIFSKLREKYDAVIHFSLSFEISSTGTNALQASKELENVYVIDTKQLSSGSGVLILSAIDKINAGKPLSEILTECENEANRVQSSFIISKLNYLYKGGRCSAVAMFGANLLKLKIRIQLINGKMEATKKYMGPLKNVLPKYVDDIIKEKPPIMKRCFVTSSSPMEGIKEEIIKKVKALGFEEVYSIQAGATICSHCGPETIGILYLSEP